jgi:epoxyqueuosine reductase
MKWMRDAERRTDPARFLAGAESVVMVAMAYPAAGRPAVPDSGPNGRIASYAAGRAGCPGKESPESHPGTAGRIAAYAAGRAGCPGKESPESHPGTAGRIAAYAAGRDYHEVMGKRLRVLCAELCSAAPCHGKPFVDSSPVMEKALAELAGLGWIGRNSLLVSREFGPWLLLGGVVLDAPMEPDAPAAFGCGECRACVGACPTGALAREGMVDARRCVSRLTVERNAEWPGDIGEKAGDRLFGCDSCLMACPFGPGEPSPAWEPREMAGAADILAMGEDEFARRFGDTPLSRAGLPALQSSASRILRHAR